MSKKPKWALFHVDTESIFEIDAIQIGIWITDSKGNGLENPICIDVLPRILQVDGDDPTLFDKNKEIRWECVEHDEDKREWWERDPERCKKLYDMFMNGQERSVAMRQLEEIFKRYVDDGFTICWAARPPIRDIVRLKKMYYEDSYVNKDLFPQKCECLSTMRNVYGFQSRIGKRELDETFNAWMGIEGGSLIHDAADDAMKQGHAYFKCRNTLKTLRETPETTVEKNSGEKTNIILFLVVFVLFCIIWFLLLAF